MMFSYVALYCVILSSTYAVEWQEKGQYEYYLELNYVYYYADAEEVCTANNATLAVIKTEDVQLSIEEILDRSPATVVLIGLQRTDGSDSGFEWVDESSLSIGYSNWQDGEPNNVNNAEDCVAIIGAERKWKDFPCAGPMQFICQRELAVKTTAASLSMSSEVTAAHSTTSDTSSGYIGCYVDASDRDLSGYTKIDASMTISTCVDICAEHGYLFAGLQNSRECYCDNDYGTYGKANEDDCNQPCQANKAQTCGGDWRNSIYKTSGYIGCYVDALDRDLSGYSEFDESMTISTCVDICAVREYLYAGLQNSYECYCDNDYGTYGKANEDDCNRPCQGNKAQTCGGDWRNSIYKTPDRQAVKTTAAHSTTSDTSSDEHECEGGVVVGSLCYKLPYRVGHRLNYADARDMCVFHGGHLAEVPTKEVYDAIFNYVKVTWSLEIDKPKNLYIGIWLGGSFQNGVVILQDGQLGYTRWRTSDNQPDNDPNQSFIGFQVGISPKHPTDAQHMSNRIPSSSAVPLCQFNLD